MFAQPGVHPAPAPAVTVSPAAPAPAASAAPAPAAPLASAPAAPGPVLPPKWAFGVLFGSYLDQAGILDAMDRLRRDYSGDLLWVDSSWLSSKFNDASKYIDFVFDPAQFPDPATLVAALHDNRFKMGVWEWPFIDVTNALYTEGAANGYFIMDSSGSVVDGGGWHGVTFTGKFDFTNPDAVAWWNSLNQPLLDIGVDFFKIDTSGGTGGIPARGVLYDGGTTGEHYRQRYHQTAFALTQAASGARGFILAHRDPTDGNDQTPGMWTGDTSASWSGFANEDMARAAQLNTEQTTGYWCGDTGGYKGDPSDELYIRWLQYSSFTPCQEFFSAKETRGRFPWAFGARAREVFQQYTQLRYRLLPFRYSNAQIAYHESPTRYPVRFLSPATHDQIVVGNGSSEILVQPVTASGVTGVQVRLPADAAWINYWTGEIYAGGTTPIVAAPLDQVPTFVKAGSIIPMGPPMQWVDQLAPDPLTLDIYPAGATTYTLYEDDGVSNEYVTGAYATTVLSSDDTRGPVVISIGSATGTYQGQPDRRTYVLKINQQRSNPGAVTRDGDALTEYCSQADFEAASGGWFYDENARITWVKFSTATTSATTVTVGQQTLSVDM